MDEVSKQFNLKALLCSLLLVLAACQPTNYSPIDAVYQGSPFEASSYQKGYYRVQKGDTLNKIASIYQLDYHQIAVVNNLRHPYVISVGQKLKIPEAKSQSRPVNTRQKNQEKQPASLPKSENTSKSKRVVLQKQVEAPVQSVKWDWPIQVKSNYKSVTNGKANGISIFADKGTQVKAAASGRVAYAGVGMVGYGNLVIIDHQNRYLSAYANNSELLVVEGQRVTVGQIIAKVGSVGVSRDQLYFEIRKDGVPQDPLQYLP